MNLKLNPNNPRTIKKDQFEKLKKSIGSFTKMLEIRPIAYDKDGVIWGGNMRYRALESLGIEMKPEYFKELKGFTLKEKQEFAIRDNVELGEWDDDALANEWSDLPLEEWGIDTSGWKSDEVVEDEAPEVSTEPAISKLGEVYQLGRHRLMCGDSTKIEDVEKLMNGQKADLIVTDPPYGVSYTGKTADALTIDNDDKTPIEMRDFWIQAFSNMCAVSKDGGCYYCCTSQGGEMMMMMIALTESGFNVKQQIIWLKNSMVLGHSDYQFKHEPIFYGWKKGGSHKFYGDRTQVSVWEVDKPNASKEHPTMKPLALLVKPINNSSKEDDIVLDLFGGSGSILIACEQLNRTCYMMEIDPKYVDVIRKRYAKFIGKEEEWQKL
jgi:DNA modification methylase